MTQPSLVFDKKRYRRVVEVPPAARGKRMVTEYYDAKRESGEIPVPGQKYSPDWQIRKKELPIDGRLFDVTTRLGNIVRLNEEQCDRMGVWKQQVSEDGEPEMSLITVEAETRPMRKGAV